jgi:hypothetical protein
MTPTFMGSDPHEVRDGPNAGWRVLGTENDQGLALIRSLSPEQQRKAMLSAAAPSDIITGPGRSEGPVNHIHSVFRGPRNDYGEDLLKQHCEQSHREPKP